MLTAIALSLLFAGLSTVRQAYMLLRALKQQEPQARDRGALADIGVSLALFAWFTCCALWLFAYIYGPGSFALPGR